MHVTTARGAKVANSKSDFYDKRYGAPKLLGDLLGGVTETRLCSTTRTIPRDLPDAPEPGAAVMGAFCFEARPGCLALKFQDLPGTTFAWLETAIEKSNAN